MIRKTFFIILTLLFVISIPTFIPIGQYNPEEDVEIFLLSNEIHIGLVVPVKNSVYDWRKFFKDEHLPKSEHEWIEFGWGDRRFYFEMPTWEQFSIGIAADALFLPDPAVMHVDFLERSPDTYSKAYKIQVSIGTYLKMVDAIKSWFILEDDFPVLIPGKSYGRSDNFYEAKESYSALKTCNIWTSDILAAAGLKHPLWSPTKYGLEFIWKNH